MSDLYTRLAQYAAQDVLPTHDDLLALVDAALSANEAYCTPLLDFTAQEQLPLVVIPDLHARRDFLLHILAYTLPQYDASVLTLLAQARLRVVCVGDLFHSERRGYERWLLAYEEYERGEVSGAAMTAEMIENLSLLQMIATLQVQFPQHFFFLKGNHENILNKTEGGDYSFRKFALEGEQVLAFMEDVYGDAVPHVISLWEHSLPLCAAFPRCVVSHAEPQRAFSKKELSRGGASVVEALTWTRNDEAEAGSVEATLTALLGASAALQAVWLSGHRPVAGRFALRQDGRLVQLHNPRSEQFALVQPDQPFNPDTDIVVLDQLGNESV